MTGSPFNFPQPDVSSETDEQFRRKVDHMIADFTDRGFNAFNVAPPLYRLAWAMGWKLVPPLFANFWKTAAFLATFWGIAWAFLMTIVIPGGEPSGFDDFDDGGGSGLEGLILLIRLGGVFFGLIMAGYYLWARHEYQIPAWADYPDGPARDDRSERRGVRRRPRREDAKDREDDIPEVLPAEEDVPTVSLADPDPRKPAKRAQPAARPARPAQPSRPGRDPRSLAGNWQGVVTLQRGAESGQVPLTIPFDQEGRPYLSLAAGQPTLITHVGQTIHAGQTVYTVEELSWPEGGCRVVLTLLRESFQQYAGEWGPGYAAGSDSSTETAITVFEFRRKGDALQVQMQTQSQTRTSMRVLDSGSTGEESAEFRLWGMLQRV